MIKRIVHINYSDKCGGAAVAAFRHNEALNRLGFDSRMLVLNKSSNSYSVVKLGGNNKIFKIKSYLFSKLASVKKKSYYPYAQYSQPVAGFTIANEQLVREADVIVLHWLGESMLSISGIEDILRLGKPVFWLFHDMWPMTGGCHYSFSCDKYVSYCHECFLLNNKRGSQKYKDISYQLFQQKLKKLSNYSNLTILTPSQWLADCASKSAIFRNCRTKVFRNVLDTETYRPIEKTFAREVLSLPLDKKLVLFGADCLNSPYKGWQYLRDALDYLTSEDIECVLFGNAPTSIFNISSAIKINYVGLLKDDISLKLLYNACDVFVTPSVADNFPNVILESMACGLPCVGFNIGGIPEMIQHGHTGFIAKKESAECLAETICEALDYPESITLGHNAREWVIKNASYESLKGNLRSLCQ